MDRVFMEVKKTILEKKQKGKRLYIALDGRCASGKTILAGKLQKVLGCNVIHMDDFFLRPEQRTKERMAEAGCNVDYERFEREVLIPLTQGKHFSYQPFSCHTQAFKAAVEVQPSEISIVEGAYACHPRLWDYYDLHLFLTIDNSVQEQRILSRNGVQGLAVFKEKWIPLEEQYFKAFQVEDRCEFKYNNIG